VGILAPPSAEPALCSRNIECRTCAIHETSGWFRVASCARPGIAFVGQ
jgi:hypothetical protein